MSKCHLTGAGIVFAVAMLLSVYFSIGKEFQNKRGGESDGVTSQLEEQNVQRTDVSTVHPKSGRFGDVYTRRVAIDADLKLRRLILDFPFPQSEVRSIVGANPPEVRKALLIFDKKSAEYTIGNQKLTKAEQNKVLWGVFFNFGWQEGDNALRDMIQDHLAGNRPFEIAHELRLAYQDLAAAGSRYSLMRDILELSDSILKIDPGSVEDQERVAFNRSVVAVKSLLIEQISASNQTKELVDLTSFSIDLYCPSASIDEVGALVVAIEKVASSSPDVALQIYYAMWKNILLFPKNSLWLTNAMLVSSSYPKNQALVFLLREDGNIIASDIPQPTRVALLAHLQALQNQQIDMSGLEVAINRLVAMN